MHSVHWPGHIRCPTLANSCARLIIASSGGPSRVASRHTYGLKAAFSSSNSRRHRCCLVAAGKPDLSQASELLKGLQEQQANMKWATATVTQNRCSTESACPRPLLPSSVPIPASCALQKCIGRWLYEVAHTVCGGSSRSQINFLLCCQTTCKMSAAWYPASIPQGRLSTVGSIYRRTQSPSAARWNSLDRYI